MFQLRNLINRRNVKKDPSDDVNSSEDFIVTVVKGHILAAVMEAFGMSILEDQPFPSLFPEKSQGLEPLQRRKLLLHKLQAVVERHVDISSSMLVSRCQLQSHLTVP